MSLLKVPNKVQIYLKKSDQSTIAQFGKCIVNFFGFADKGSGYVGFIHEGNTFTIYELQSPEDPSAVLIRHATECPVFKMTSETPLPQELQEKGVGMGVAVLLTSSDQSVLVTRRAPHMRTFPGVWVPPGGHVEPEETVLKAGLRELQEETGLNLENTSYHILGLWESVYPHKLEYGDPVRQHIVIYLALASSLPSWELTKLLKLEPKETDAAMWLPFSFVEKIATGNSVEDIPKHVSVLQLLGDKNEQFEVDTEPIVEAMAPPPNSTPLDIERLTWGTRFALQEWVKWNSSKKLNVNDSKL